MTQEHPITLPPELIAKWAASMCGYHEAARWGADMELDACCQTLYQRYDIPTCIPPKLAEEMRDWLRAARRPKPPSLKELALEALDDAVLRGDCITISDALPTIRRALEFLPD